MLPVVSLLCLALIAAPLAYGFTDNKAAVFYTFFNGQLNNGAQNGSGHDYVAVRMVPIDAPALDDKNPVVYAEEVANGAIQIFHVGIFQDLPGTNKLNLKLFNFIDYKNIEPLTYDYNQVAILTPDALTSDDDCFASFEIHENGLLTGVFPDCKVFDENGVHPRFDLAFECQHEVAVFPKGINQKATQLPYVLSPIAKRYEVPNTSPDFDTPCPEEYKF